MQKLRINTFRLTTSSIQKSAEGLLRLNGIFICNYPMPSESAVRAHDNVIFTPNMPFHEPEDLEHMCQNVFIKKQTGFPITRKTAKTWLNLGLRVFKYMFNWFESNCHVV